MISDSSPLILLARAGRLQLLESLFGSVLIPDQVRREALAGQSGTVDANRIKDAIDEDWIQIQEPAGSLLSQVEQRHPNLGPGEQATLALAQTEEARTVLMDDRLARQAARYEGLQPVGCLGLLLRAYHQGALASRGELQSCVQEVLDAGLWVSADVIEAFWERAGGRP